MRCCDCKYRNICDSCENDITSFEKCRIYAAHSLAYSLNKAAQKLTGNPNETVVIVKNNIGKSE